jgi:hypothetical protein
MMPFRPSANAFLAVFVFGAASAQTPAAGPRFEVASIKPTEVTPETMLSRFGVRINAARVDIGYVSIRDLIVAAYRIRPDQVWSPAWITDARFDIVATIKRPSRSMRWWWRRMGPGSSSLPVTIPPSQAAEWAAGAERGI